MHYSIYKFSWLLLQTTWKTRLPGYIVCSESCEPQKVYSRNLYQKKKTMKRTESPAPIATQDVALREVASFLYWLKFIEVGIWVEKNFVLQWTPEMLLKLT